MENNNKVVTRVETLAHARWKVKSTTAYQESEPFKVGIWNWVLSVEMISSLQKINIGYSNNSWHDNFLSFGLFPILSSKEEPLYARFTFGVSTDGSQSTVTHNGLLPKRGFFKLLPDDCDEYVVNVAFLSLKILPSKSGEYISVFPHDMRPESKRSSSNKYFSRMLKESLYTDITINTLDGKLEAHKAVISASSPVFQSMFAHDLKEKQSSTIDIMDMTSESCIALLNYMYGIVNKEEFSKHWPALLAAANIYFIPELKDECEESLLHDIDVENVLERLQAATDYNLDKLKKRCYGFLRSSDDERVQEMLEDALCGQTRENLESTEEGQRKKPRRCLVKGIQHYAESTEGQIKKPRRRLVKGIRH